MSFSCPAPQLGQRRMSISKTRSSSRAQLMGFMPGKPWQNGTDESFNGPLRDECLSVE
jgi:putative transposase